MGFVNPDTSVLNDKKLFIFDMDGTVYLSEKPFDYAVRYIKNLRANGKKVLFFTNNSSHTTSYYQSSFTRIGFEPREGEIMTSGDVTLEFLKKNRAGKSVYMVATDELCEQFRQSGIRLLCGDEEKADIVVTAFDTTLTDKKVENGCRFIRGGAEFIATHPDMYCPTETGFIPDGGAIAAIFTEATGVSPTFFGKPYEQTIRMIGEATGFKNDEMCIFGDRLYTDIALGKRFGVTAVLVLTGEASRLDVQNAADEDKPDFVFDSLDDVDKIMFGSR